MSKSLCIALSLIIAAITLPGCKSRQGPSPADTAPGQSGFGDGMGPGIVPDGIGPNDWGLNAPGLEPRDTAFGAGGMYGGRQMVEGELASVYFGFDSSSVSAAERSKLQAAADYLMENPSDGLLIEGHADWYGTAEYNLALGDRRANSVRDYLSTLGVSSGRIETLSKGSLEATSGLSKSESGEDRRADLIILK